MSLCIGEIYFVLIGNVPWLVLSAEKPDTLIYIIDSAVLPFCLYRVQLLSKL